MSFLSFPGLRKPKRLRTIRTRTKPTTTEEFTFRDRVVCVERRPYSRRVSVTVHVSGGLRVKAPSQMPIKDIVKFLESTSEWIRERDEVFAKLRATHPAKRYASGELFPFLGSQLRLAFREGSGARFRFDVNEDALIIAIPPREWQGFDPLAPHPELAGRVNALYLEAAKQFLSQRVLHYSGVMNLRPRKVCIRRQKTRWGSCNSHADIALNAKLIVAPLFVLDYVVVHELAHIAHLNHSRTFWNLVGQYSPRYREAMAWLKTHQFESDFLSKKSELHT